MNKQRIEKWDITRGVLVFLVVFGHMAECYCDDARLFKAVFIWIYLFHMPCFLFLGGLFSKRTINEKRYHKIFSYLLLYLTAKFSVALAKCAITHKHELYTFKRERYALVWSGAFPLLSAYDIPQVFL